MLLKNLTQKNLAIINKHMQISEPHSLVSLKIMNALSQSELNRQGGRPRKRQRQLTEYNINKAHANMTELARAESNA